MNTDRLIKELAQCRKLGFAEERGDIRPGIHAVSAPVMGPGGKGDRVPYASRYIC